MELIAVVGRQGSGKDAVSDYIAEKYGYTHVASGDILRDYIINNNKGDSTRSNLQRVVTGLRKREGQDVLVRIALQSNSKENKLLISGLRNPEEIKLIRKHKGKVIAIIADPKVRYQRTKKRGREGDNISFDEFKKLEELENKSSTWGLESVIRLADYFINNDNGSNKLFHSVDTVMQEIKKSSAVNK